MYLMPIIAFALGIFLSESIRRHFDGGKLHWQQYIILLELVVITIVSLLPQGSYDNINLLINRVGNNPLIIKNEINKIKQYKDQNKTITEEDIIKITTKTIDIDIFKLIDNIVKGNKDEAIEIYKEMLKVNEEPLKIVIMLANQFRLMYQSKELLKKGYSEKDIASILKVHPYRVKLALQNSRTYDSKKLLKYISDLADIDIGIKTGVKSKDLSLELFILK